MLRRLLEALILPPTSLLLLLVLGTVLRRWWPRFGRALQIGAVLSLWLLSTPFVAGALLRTLQTDAPLPAIGELPPADAIVILSAEADREAREYGGAVIGPMTMQRVRYGAFLHKRTQLPILASGGKPSTDAPPLAELMARALEQEFSVFTRWREESSLDTWENARLSAELLQKEGVKRILLVSSAWHLPRAARCFRQNGLEVVPAPTAFRGPPFENMLSLVPHWQGLRDTGLALHEWIGRAFYAFRYGT